MRARAAAAPRRANPLAGRVAAAAQAAAALPLRETAPHAPARPRRAPRAVPRSPRKDLPLGARLVAWVRGLPDHRLLDRLIGGRIWIVLVCTLLVGLVTLQLSLLKLNAGIGTAVQKSAQLEERNAALRVANSQLTDPQRISELGTKMGLVMPPQGSPRFRASGRADVSAALSTMRVPDPALAAAAATALGAETVTDDGTDATATTDPTATTDAAATGTTDATATATDGTDVAAATGVAETTTDPYATDTGAAVTDTGTADTDTGAPVTDTGTTDGYSGATDTGTDPGATETAAAGGATAPIE